MRYFFIIGLLLFGLYSSAQEVFQLPSNSSDCRNAIEINDSLFGPTTAPKGYGEMMEIKGSKHSLYHFEKEHNSCWYQFTAQHSGDLCLEIIPTNADDDYDFLLYRDTAYLCEFIMQNKHLPVRTNISRNKSEIAGKTGLSLTATQSHINSGPGEAYSKALPVKKGERYYLVLDNVYPNGDGHSIRLTYHNIQDNQKAISSEKQSQVSLVFQDKNSGNKLPCGVQIKYAFKKPDAAPDFSFKPSDSVVTQLDYGRDYYIYASADNYFTASVKVKVKKDEDQHLIVKLTPIQKGERISLEDIEFYSGQARILPASKPALKYLLQLMKSNPDLVIEIRGHVNQPINAKGRKSNSYLQSLSEQRAKAVLDYLRQRGVDKKRLQFKGMSNKEMLFPYAKNKAEARKNRRVEIVVISA